MMGKVERVGGDCRMKRETAVELKGKGGSGEKGNRERRGRWRGDRRGHLIDIRNTTDALYLHQALCKMHNR